MLPFSRKKKFLVGLIAGIVIVTGVLGYFLLRFDPGLFNISFSQGTEFAGQDGKLKIAASTDLVQKIIYLKCNDEEVIRTKPEENLIGLNFYQLQKVYPGWTIDKFDAKEIVMSLKVDSFCREHANNMFIGLKDGYVAVYYGKPGANAIIKEVTGISTSKLMAQDIEELKKGIIIQSREELLRTLEGLQSR